jgi:heparosan-N-sulfate-glucuronate 5-epimerase
VIRWAAVAAVAGLAVSGGDPVRQYDPAGTYLHYAVLPSIVRTPVSLDGRGIPRVRYGRRGPARYNPVTVAQYGLQEFSYFASGRGRSHLANAERAAAWLMRTQEANGRWLYRFAWHLRGSRVGLRPPWASAMAQGQAMSLLTRVFRATGDDRYLVAARRARLPLERSVSAGGLAASFRGRGVYEEYPTRPPSLVLNGFMFTLLGLHDLQNTAPNRRTKRLLHDGLESLAALLPLYKRPVGSLYDLGHLTGARRRPRAAGWAYHRRHLRLLDVLAEVSGRRELAAWRSPPGASRLRAGWTNS